MTRKKNIDRTNKNLNRILMRKDLTKNEKIAEMFHIFRELSPDETQEKIYEWCKKYYNFKLGNINPDKYYLS